MSIFSLVKGEKEHEVFEMRMCGEGFLNSYNNSFIVSTTFAEAFPSSQQLYFLRKFS